MEVVIESVVTKRLALCLSLPSFCAGWMSRGSSMACARLIRGHS
ncbi:hypothetical protein ACH4GP_07020 [Streptomyces celluloflavus]|uniref:Uncharacterized protein n=2 Tax=Streptomyces celluloflavus TaxID=58344 RepID=A0ABW7R7W0_9ACTN